MFLVITIVFILIGLIAFYGDYETKEMEQDYEYFKKLCG